MRRYQVISLDVWGHGPSDCAEHRCSRCCDEDADGNVTHNDDHCDCSYWVNDRSRAGVIELEANEDDSAIVRALIDGGYLKNSVTDSDVAIDGDDEFISVDDAETGEPLFQLEATGDDQ